MLEHLLDMENARSFPSSFLRYTVLLSLHTWSLSKVYVYLLYFSRYESLLPPAVVCTTSQETTVYILEQ